MDQDRLIIQIDCFVGFRYAPKNMGLLNPPRNDNSLEIIGRLEGEEEGVMGGVDILVAADEVNGAGGGTGVGCQLSTPGGVAGGGDEGTTKAAWFCLPPEGGTPREEAPGDDNHDAFEDGEGGEDLADIMEQGGGVEIGISSTFSCKRCKTAKE
jgi:hypothetical protein